MTTVEILALLLDRIETIVSTANAGCEIDSYKVTAGQPPAPTGQCSAVQVWASSAFNSSTSLFQEDNPCVFARGLQLNWRLDLCFDAGEKDPTPEETLAIATCFYGLADAIYCGIVPATGLKLAPFDAGCSNIDVDALTYNEASGGMLSAESGIRLQADCPPEPTS